jgi:hypothetical protein
MNEKMFIVCIGTKVEIHNIRQETLEDMEVRWSEPPERQTAILSGILKKTSLLRASGGYAPRYVSLVPEYLYSYPESHSIHDPLPPLSRLSLHGLVVTNNTDSPNGFNLLPAAASGSQGGDLSSCRVKCIAPDIETKQQWVEALHKAITATATVSTKLSVNNRQRGSSLVDRSTKSVKEGILEKRQGRLTGYQKRWVEIRRGVGLLYGKFRSSEDDTFKPIPLLDAIINVNPDKFRFSLKNNAGEDIYFRCPNILEFAQWMEALEHEVHPLRGRDGKRLSPEEEQRVRQRGGRPQYTLSTGGGGDNSSGMPQRLIGSADSTTEDGAAGDEVNLQTFRAFGDDSQPSAGVNGSALFGDELVTEVYPQIQWLKTSTFQIRIDDEGNETDVTPRSCHGHDGEIPCEIVAEDADDNVNVMEVESTLTELADMMGDAPHTGIPQARDSVSTTLSGGNLPLIGSNGSAQQAISRELTPVVPLTREQILYEKLFDPSRLNAGVKVYLESVSTMYEPTTGKRPIDGVNEVLVEAIQQFPGTKDQIDRIRDRIYSPLDGTYQSINEHIVLLDLDTQQLRVGLTALLQSHGSEEAIRSLVVETDDLLRQYTCVRDHLVVQRNIVSFRAQKDHCGLKLGVDQTLEFVRKLVTKDRGVPTEANWRKILQLYEQLYACLDTFRLEYDVFEASLGTIEELEDALECAREWLAINEALLGSGSVVAAASPK